MKSLYLLLAFGASTLKVFPQLAAEYRFEATCNNLACADNCHGTGTPNPFYVNPAILVSAGPCNLGAGVSGTGGLPCGNMNGFAAGLPSNPNRARWADNWSGAFGINDYFGITLTAQPAMIVFIDSVRWDELRSNTGPTARQLRTSSDGFATPVWTGSNGLSATWVAQSVTSGLPSFTSALPLDIRIYGYTTGGSAGSLRIDNLRIYVHIFSTLPVELLSFTGKAVDQDVELSWTTASELDNNHFEIMRSNDGQAWYEVGRVPGSGTTTIPRDYGFLDSGPSVGVNYYKIRQVDVGGEYEDSHTISVKVGEREWFRRVGDQIISDQPTMLFDELGRLISGPSREHRIVRTGILILRQEDGAKSERLFVEP